MSEGINLLLDKNKNKRKNKEIIKAFRITSIVLLFLVAISSVLVFSFKLQSPLTNLQNEEQDVLSKISVLHPKTARLFLASDRIKNISEIISKRPDFEKRITIILKAIPNDVSLSAFTIDNKNVSIVATSTSLSSIGQMLDNLVAMVANKELFNKINLQGLTVDGANGTYRVSIEAILL